MEYPTFSMVGDYTSKRFVLHHIGAKTLVVVGCNPSIASDLSPDNTMQNVCRIATANGYDGIVMINLSAQRATNPDELDTENNADLHQENLEAIINVLNEVKTFDILLAYGGLIHKRKYLKNNLSDLLSIFSNYKAPILAYGINKDGTPKHPCPRTGLPKDLSLKLYNTYSNGK